VDELDGFVARGGDSGVNVFLILDEERFEIELVDMGRALELWEREKKEKQRLGFPIEGEPVQEPLGGVLESNKNTSDCPVTSPLLQLTFIQRTLPERFESTVGWEKKSKPPAGESQVKSAYVENKQTHVRRRETINTSMVEGHRAVTVVPRPLHYTHRCMVT